LEFGFDHEYKAVDRDDERERERERERESNGDWLLRRPRLTQGCSAERKGGRIIIRLILAAYWRTHLT